MFRKYSAGYHEGVEYRIAKGTFVYILGIDWKQTLKRRKWWWRVEEFRVRSVNGRYTGDVDSVVDALLRPIRPGDGEDEILRIAGKPVSKEDSCKPVREAA